jgi:hypothetical protein
MRWAICAATVLLVVAVAAVLMRWQVTPLGPDESNGASAFLLDRWTGTLHFLGGNKKILVKPVEREAR